MTIKEKRRLKSEIVNYIASIFSDKNEGEKASTKLNNICDKTGRYGVPNELFQERTSRNNRVLISWKDVKNNRLTFEQLKSFSGGVVVEFVNEDYFLQENQENSVFNMLKEKIGGDEIVSAIITIRSESGESSSSVQREYFSQLLNNTSVKYKGTNITINKDNYEDYLLKRTSVGGKGNEKWEGFLYVSIKGGNQDTIQPHKNNHQLLFNPACEFATDKISCDIDNVMLYFALKSIRKKDIRSKLKREKYNEVLHKLEECLRESIYNSEDYCGNLLDYCNNHMSLTMKPGSLMDPIQALPISIRDFAIDNKQDERNLDFTHNEAINKKKYYWDDIQECILTAARPTNVFWSKHLSNMIQQNMNLKEYIDFENENNKRRKRYLRKNERNN